MTARSEQLALKFPLSTRAHFDTFEAGANGELVRRLQALAGIDGFTGCFLYGAQGVGRTHLLQAACQGFDAVSAGRAIYLPLADPELGPESLDGLETLALVAVDDVDAWLGDPDAELALLALYQGLHEASGRLLVSARRPATALSFWYQDLASRLRSMATYHVRPLDDVHKSQVLRRLAGERGLELSPAVLDYWLTRRSRDLARLLEDLDLLDDAAMAAQRRVTVPLLKAVLDL